MCQEKCDSSTRCGCHERRFSLLQHAWLMQNQQINNSPEERVSWLCVATTSQQAHYISSNTYSNATSRTKLRFPQEDAVRLFAYYISQAGALCAHVKFTSLVTPYLVFPGYVRAIQDQILHDFNVIVSCGFVEQSLFVLMWQRTTSECTDNENDNAPT